MSRRLFVALLALAAAACRQPHPEGPDVPPPTAADEVELLPPPVGAPTWESWTNAFVGDYCVPCHSPTATCGGSGCHAAGDPLLPDYRDKTAFIAQASTIRCGVAASALAGCAGALPKEFPKWNGHNPLPPDDDRARIVAWIEAGTP